MPTVDSAAYDCFATLLCVLQKSYELLLDAIPFVRRGSTVHIFLITELSMILRSIAKISKDIVCTKNGLSAYDVPKITNKVSHSSTTASKITWAKPLCENFKWAGTGTTCSFNKCNSLEFKKYTELLEFILCLIL